MTMFIVLDSNIWISQVGLQSKNGAAIRHFIRRRNATLVIPEVVALEVEQRLSEQMLDRREAIETNYRQLLPIMGTMQALHLPSEEEIREAVAVRILDLGVPTRRLSLDLEAARSAMLKLITKQPPSKSKQQFRDGVIWYQCLTLLAEGDVYLVTHDKDFYEERNYTKGLARELDDEVSAHGGKGEVKLFHELPKLLQEIRVAVDLDDGDVFQVVREAHSETISELLTAHGFALAGRVRGGVQYFATERAEEIYFTFGFSHPCEDVVGGERRDGDLKLKGFGFLDSDTHRARKVSLSRVRLDYPDWVPGGTARGTVFVSGHANAPQVHEIRFSLGTLEEKQEGRQ